MFYAIFPVTCAKQLFHNYRYKTTHPIDFQHTSPQQQFGSNVTRIRSPNRTPLRFTRVITRGLLTRGFRFFIAESLHAVRVCSRSNLVRHQDRAEDLEGLIDGVPTTPVPPGQRAEQLYTGGGWGGHGLARLGVSGMGGRDRTGGGPSIITDPDPALMSDLDPVKGSGPPITAAEKHSNYAAVIVEGRNHYALE